MPGERRRETPARCVSAPPGGPSRWASPLAAAALAGAFASTVVFEAVAGAARSPLLPRLPRGVGAPAWTRSLARVLRLDPLGERPLVTVALIVLVVAAAAFVVLAREALAGRVALGVVLAVAFVDLAVVALGPPVLSRDVDSYAAYGRIAVVDHANPYTAAPGAFRADPFSAAVSAEWLHSTSVYGPAFTLLSEALVRAGGRSTDAVIRWFRGFAALSAAVALGLAVVVARRVAPGREPLAAVLVGLNPAFVLHAVGGAHNDVLVAALLAAAFALASRRLPEIGARAAAVTALLTLAVAVKVAAAPALFVWLVWLARAAARRSRADGPRATDGGPRATDGRGAPATAVVAGHVAEAIAIVAALSAPFMSAGRHVLDPYLAPATREGWASASALVAGGARSIGRALAGARVGGALATATKASFLVLFAVLLVRLLVRPHAHAARVAGVGLLGLALASPYLLPWYVAWFAPLLATARARVVTIGVAIAAALALTGVPAEPGRAPSTWHRMISLVHGAGGAITLVLLLALLSWAFRPRHPGDAGAMATSRFAKARA